MVLGALSLLPDRIPTFIFPPSYVAILIPKVPLVEDDFRFLEKSTARTPSYSERHPDESARGRQLCLEVPQTVDRIARDVKRGLRSVQPRITHAKKSALGISLIRP